MPRCAEVEEKAADLQRVNRLKAQFLSNMSHEFRTPLNSLLSLTRLLLDRTDGDLTPEQEKQANYLWKTAHDLSGMVNDLLDLAKIEAGRITVRPVEFQTEALLGTLRGMMRPVLGDKNVEFVVGTPEGITPLYSDEAKIAQILRNLMSNAFEFTEQGEVRVSARMAPGGREVVFTVADTGIGIAPEHLEYIFEEYTQVETPLHHKARGTGLGLALSRKLAGLLGGRIEVESTPGRGSVFSVTLPVRYSPAEARAAETLGRVDGFRRQVVVVEDDDPACLLYEKHLQGTGIQPLHAKTLAEARELLRNTQPLAIVLDVLLKGENGFDLLAEIKAQERLSEIPVLVATILDEADKGFALGADDYVTKPVSRNLLLGRLDRLARSVPVEKILVVDDDERARYVVKGSLAGTKYQTLEAASGVEGLEIARREHPDLIILDLVMPGMTGFEVLEQLRADPATARTPVIIATAQTLDEKEHRFLREAATAVLSKGATGRDTVLGLVNTAVMKRADAAGGEFRAVRS